MHVYEWDVPTLYIGQLSTNTCLNPFFHLSLSISSIEKGQWQPKECRIVELERIFIYTLQF